MTASQPAAPDPAQVRHGDDAGLAEWFSNNLTSETFRLWGDEDFAQHLADDWLVDHDARVRAEAAEQAAEGVTAALARVLLGRRRDGG